MALRKMRTVWAAVALVAVAFMTFGGVTTPAHAEGMQSLTTSNVMNTNVSETADSGGCAFQYVVRRGDTLSKLTSRWVSIAQTNAIRNPNRIFVGQTLCLTTFEAQGFRRALDMGTPQSVHVVVTKSTVKTMSTATGTGNTGSVVNGGQPCAGQAIQWPASFSLWEAPAGCYGRIFSPNPANYVARSGFGWCNWWPEVLNPSVTNLLSRPKTSVARPGAVVWFPAGLYGAGGAGHWAQVVAIHGSWMLITEMNFSWRGGGWQKVDYRFVPVSGESFIVL